MENPATWGEAERIIDKVVKDWVRNSSLPSSEKRFGLSVARQVADALREEGLLVEEAPRTCTICGCQPDEKHDTIKHLEAGSLDTRSWST